MIMIPQQMLQPRLVKETPRFTNEYIAFCNDFSSQEVIDSSKFGFLICSGLVVQLWQGALKLLLTKNLQD